MPVAVVTGANSGIGKALAKALVARDFEIVMACRDQGRGDEARREIAGTRPNVELMLCDLARPAAIRAFADALRARHPRVDVLVHNAGVYLPTRQVTPDGRETMFAVNHLGPFLLTALLLDRLEGARVVTVSSIAHHFCRFDLDNLEGERWFNGIVQYGLTKLANILFTRELARRQAGRLVANCFHPGGVATNFAQGPEWSLLGFGARVGRLLLRTPEQGAETGVFLATGPAAARVTGEYWQDGRLARTSGAARSVENARALWERSAALVGLPADGGRAG